jgi:hypothetical protein
LVSDGGDPREIKAKLHHHRHLKDLGRAYTRNIKHKDIDPINTGSPLNDCELKRKSYKLRDLSMIQRLSIAYETIVELNSQRDVA